LIERMQRPQQPNKGLAIVRVVKDWGAAVTPVEGMVAITA
jgi:hypothetical protein